MEAPPKINEPSETLPPRKRSYRRRILLAALALIILGSLTVFVLDALSPRMVWLTPAELQQASQQGVISRLKYRLAVALGPLNRFIFHRKKDFVHIDSSILALSSASSAKINLGAPMTTNPGGARAWILSPEELNSFTNQLNALPDHAHVSKPRIDTVDGVRSQMSVGNRVRVGNDYAQIGLLVDIIPKVANGKIKLIVGVTDTEHPESDSLSAVKTNLAVACRVIVPDAGAVVIDGGGTGESHYWLVISPVIVDATGKPIKH